MTAETPKVVPLRPVVNAEAVRRARELLEECEAGRLCEFHYCATTPDGGVRTMVMATDDQMRRLAAVARLLHLMHMRMDEMTGDLK